MSSFLNMFEKSFKYNPELAKFMGRALVGDRYAYLDKVDKNFLSRKDKEALSKRAKKESKVVKDNLKEEVVVITPILKCILTQNEYCIKKEEETTSIIKKNKDSVTVIQSMSNDIGEDVINASLKEIFSNIVDEETATLDEWFDSIETPMEERDNVVKSMILSVSPNVDEKGVEEGVISSFLDMFEKTVTLGEWVEEAAVEEAAEEEDVEEEAITEAVEEVEETNELNENIVDDADSKTTKSKKK